MKKLRLPLLTALLTIALVGLVGLQFYWTNMAYQIVRQRFKQTAHEALQAVAQKLEQREIIYATQRSAGKLQDSLKYWEQQRLEYDQKRLSQMQDIEAQKIREQEARKQAIKSSNQSKIEIVLKENTQTFQPQNIQEIFIYKPKVVVSSSEYKWVKKGDSMQNFFFKQENKTVQIQTDNSFSPKITEVPHAKVSANVALPTLPEKKFIKIESKEDVLKFLVQELKHHKPELDKRLNKRLLDSLLHKEFAGRGIHLPYNFGVEVLPRRQVMPVQTLHVPQHVSQHVAQLTDLDSYEKPRYLFFNTEMEKKKTLQSNFHQQLFPTEIIGNRNTLFVDFPQEINWLWREMALTVGASVLFISLIIGCFAYTLYTIWRQKKISEVTNDFINNMTHEFKTPVATVALACEALQDPDMRQNANYTDRYLQIIKEENERVGRQVERVLQIAMLDKADFRLKIQTCDLHDMAQKAIHKIGLLVESRQGSIHTDFQATQSCLQADEAHLTSVILNLLDNAVKYSPDAPHITLTTQNTEDGILLHVKDQGQGMTKDAQSKIFDKFYRVPTGNIHNVKGFGLGLNYVRTIIQAHHGRISVQSEVGKGSTFTFFLPKKA